MCIRDSLYTFPHFLQLPSLFPGWSATLVLLIPYGAHTIAVHRCRRWEAETKLLHLISYGGTLMVIAVLFVGIQKFIAVPGSRVPSTVVLLINISEVLLSALLFAPLRKLLHRLAVKHFYPLYHQRQKALMAFSEQLHNCLTITEVAKAVMRHFHQSVPVEQQSFLKKEGERIIPLFESDDLPMVLESQEFFDKSVLLLNSGELRRVEPWLSLPGTYFSLPYVLMQPIGNELYWLIGAPLAGSIFYREDLQFTRNLAATTEKHILILNALYRKMEGEWQSDGENLNFGE